MGLSGQNKDDKQPGATGMQKTIPGLPQGFPPNMMNFMPGGITPEMLQMSLQQGNPGQSLPQNMGLPQGMAMPQSIQGMGLPPGMSLQPALSMLTP